MNVQNNVGLAANQSVKYLEGHPRQYRFDAIEGFFSINGTDKLGRSLTIQTMAWRVFTDNILNLGTRHWAELFFIDNNSCVSAILFHGQSVERLFRLIEPLYYDDRTLADVVLTIVAERRMVGPLEADSDSERDSTQYIANFGFVPADPARTVALTHYALTHKIFRQETLTQRYVNALADIRAAMHYPSPVPLASEQVQSFVV